jgi:phosphoenolpyruvate phosphomutase
VTYAEKVRWEDSGELVSLKCGLDAADRGGDLFVSYGDVLFKRYLVEQLLETDADWCIAVDALWQASVNRGRSADYVHCSAPHARGAPAVGVALREAGAIADQSRIHGEWMGFLRIAASRRQDFARLIGEVIDGNARASMCDLLNVLVARGEHVRVVYGTGNWLDIDSLDDLVAAGRF